MSNPNFRPFRDRVLVRPFDEQEGTIKVPDSDRAKPDHGIIVAVGLGGLTDHGEIIPMKFKPDDHVYFGKYAGTEIEIDGEKLRIMSEAEILGEVAVSDNASTGFISFLEPCAGPIIPGQEHREVVYAKNQPEYNPLRTLVEPGADGAVLSRWSPTLEQRQRIAAGEDIYLRLLTFRQRLQPIQLFIARENRVAVPEHDARACAGSPIPALEPSAAAVEKAAN